MTAGVNMYVDVDRTGNVYTRGTVMIAIKVSTCNNLVWHQVLSQPLLWARQGQEEITANLIDMYKCVRNVCSESEMAVFPRGYLWSYWCFLYLESKYDPWPGMFADRCSHA